MIFAPMALSRYFSVTCTSLIQTFVAHFHGRMLHRASLHSRLFSVARSIHTHLLSNHARKLHSFTPLTRMHSFNHAHIWATKIQTFSATIMFWSLRFWPPCVTLPTHTSLLGPKYFYTPPPYRETGAAVPLARCVSCGIADYRCYTPTSFRENGLAQSKDRPNKGGIAEKACL